MVKDVVGRILFGPPLSDAERKELKGLTCNDPDCVKVRRELEAFRQLVQHIVDSFSTTIDDTRVVWEPEWYAEAKKLLEANNGK